MLYGALVSRACRLQNLGLRENPGVEHKPDTKRTRELTKGMNCVERTVDRPVLENYLFEHLVSSQSCLNRLYTVRQLWRSPAQSAELEAVYEQARDDRNDLRAIIGRLGFIEEPLSTWRKVLKRGRALILNVAVLHRSDAHGRQMELDIIAGQLHAKLAMWNTLLSLVTSDIRLDPVQLMYLAGRTQGQIDALAKLSEESRSEEFITHN